MTGQPKNEIELFVDGLKSGSSQIRQAKGTPTQIANIVRLIEALPSAYRPEYRVENLFGGEQILFITADAKIAFCIAFGHDWEFEYREYGDDRPQVATCRVCGIFDHKKGSS
jgi:hypothetical protein